MKDSARPRKPVLLLDVVGMTPALLEHMPNLRAIATEGFRAELGTVFPAVTCPVQSSLLTGRHPGEHGIVGNGWYFRDIGEVFFWRQHNGLVQGEKVWQAARELAPDHRTSNICWWYAMGMDTDETVTPRPIYHADGRKSPDCYTRPAELRDELTAEFGTFPLFNYWGPTASLASSRWIADATRHVMSTRNSDLTMAYVPHLDYDLQRHGPDSPQAARAAREVDGVLEPLLRHAREQGVSVVALSEYGITPVDRPVDVNRALRGEGLLNVHTQAGMEYLDPWSSRAFAVADHQVAHVYVNDPGDLRRTREVVSALPGVDEVLDSEGKARYGIAHQRAGDLVAIAEPNAWFTYYYWLDDERAPDFATHVEIHRKPGYDPAELFMDPRDRWVRLRAAAAVARKKIGLRYRMNVVPLDPTPVRGSHGRLPDRPRDGPVLLCSDPALARQRYHATEVKDLLLRLSGLDRAVAAN
ncbi:MULTISPECIES: alkaline phosphatase family protein [Actinopolyspora]|uniref:Predicted pyrophosphatase or phosphodiesterase, AlkP superfamily n=1 Tax=Actinopolyspora saharensis TaxID=995062 RepID=A0A1H1EJ42_9ACTN|nr:MULTISPECIES: nucleotide pyrophosphatase/phosphodiesterase family protein [Actinopolyspora]NHD19109.1 alkaline phosphatase family protein [Actinopolyspora sp. BKK2]NHE78106.1 alkaline phosphatase family protein [Actinopolyspora sp. BKK1]SDQ88479.1 Predicted pyrophosphatase or phosphodiesterase, AlkP superfamily [Actinopolyspora saharensis]